MNKDISKNILIILFLTAALFSGFRYVSVEKEKYRLSSELNQSLEKNTVLENQKQGLLEAVEKEKGLRQELEQKVSSLKDNMRAAEGRLNKLFSDYQEAQSKITELDDTASLLQSENQVLREEKERVVQENETLKIKLSSLTELKKAIKEVKKQAQKVGLQIIKTVQKKKDVVQGVGGNSGFLVKDGKNTYPVRLKIEVKPLKENE